MTKNKAFRILVLSLILGIVASIMISCAKNDGDGTDTTVTAPDSSETGPVESGTQNKPNTPNWDYKPGGNIDKPDVPVPDDPDNPTPVLPAENPKEEPADDTANDNF